MPEKRLFRATKPPIPPPKPPLGARKRPIRAPVFADALLTVLARYRGQKTFAEQWDEHLLYVRREADAARFALIALFADKTNGMRAMKDYASLNFPQFGWMDADEGFGRVAWIIGAIHAPKGEAEFRKAFDLLIGDNPIFGDSMQRLREMLAMFPPERRTIPYSPQLLAEAAKRFAVATANLQFLLSRWQSAKDLAEALRVRDEKLAGALEATENFLEENNVARGKKLTKFSGLPYGVFPK